MANKVKMQIKNADGKEIEREVPENLISNYEALGWKRIKKEVKEENKDREDSSSKSLNK
jgi:hypothetical protein